MKSRSHYHVPYLVLLKPERAKSSRENMRDYFLSQVLQSRVVSTLGPPLKPHFQQHIFTSSPLPSMSSQTRPKQKSSTSQRLPSPSSSSNSIYAVSSASPTRKRTHKVLSTGGTTSPKAHRYRRPASRIDTKSYFYFTSCLSGEIIARRRSRGCWDYAGDHCGQ